MLVLASRLRQMRFGPTLLRAAALGAAIALSAAPALASEPEASGPVNLLEPKAGLMFWTIERTKAGAAIRASAEKPEMVDLLGMDARRVHMLVFGAGTALAMLAGGPAPR